MHACLQHVTHTHIAYYNGLEENIANIRYSANIFGNFKWKLCGTVYRTKMLKNKRTRTQVMWAEGILQGEHKVFP